jgi:nucleotide-binding universal stress UspA family protein
MAFQCILVSLDESDLGQQVFQQALELAIACRAQLHLLHVLQPLSPTLDLGAEAMAGGMSDLGSYPLFSDPGVWEAQNQSQKDHAQGWLTRYLEQAHHAGVVVEWSCPTGEPGSSICTLARTLQADLIVIGRRGLSGLAEVMVGSVSNYVTHHAPCSVLVVQAIAHSSHA